MSCKSGGRRLTHVMRSEPAWDNYDRCATIANVRERVQCRLVHTLKENTMRKLDQYDPKPDADDEDLSELVQAQSAAKRKGLRAIYAAHRAAGASHAVAMVHTRAACAKQLADPQPAAPNLPPALAKMVADLAANNMSGAAADVTARFRARYAKETAKVSRDIAANIAANDAQDYARRLLGLIGPKGQADEGDDADISYLTANRLLTEAVQKIQAADPSKDYNTCLAKAVAANPERALRVSRGYALASVTTATEFQARDAMVEAIESLLASEPTLTWTQAYERVAAEDVRLHERVVAERHLVG